MTAKGKINASKVQAGDRILVQHSAFTEGLVQITHRKTGEGVHVARVTFKEFVPAGRNRARGTYTIHTTSGISPGHEPVQTMWLAPEDAAGVKRAHVEALALDATYVATPAAEVMDEPSATAQADQECPECGGPLASDGVCADDECGADEELPDPDDASTEASPAAQEMDEPSATAQIAAERENHTGSTVVSLLEKVWARIRADHPELPEVVIITGSGLVGTSKWGHFRAEGWKVKEEGAALRKHELFLAGEALAKGARQVLQTMLHEGAHTLARVRDLKDTSRQGRWHNATFRKLAEEMGLEHKGATTDSSNGFSFVTLTQATTDRYADLLEELDREIRLVCHLPVWLGGSDEEEKGGEKIGPAPKGEDDEDKPRSGPLKATCECEDPIIVRLSQKVLDLKVVRCDRCEALFTAA